MDKCTIVMHADTADRGCEDFIEFYSVETDDIELLRQHLSTIEDRFSDGFTWYFGPRFEIREHKGGICDSHNGVLREILRTVAEPKYDVLPDEKIDKLLAEIHEGCTED